jgi:hypothetical protein
MEQPLLCVAALRHALVDLLDALEESSRAKSDERLLRSWSRVEAGFRAMRDPMEWTMASGAQGRASLVREIAELVRLQRLVQAGAAGARRDVGVVLEHVREARRRLAYHSGRQASGTNVDLAG